jgi:hypothetical protein
MPQDRDAGKDHEDRPEHGPYFAEAPQHAHENAQDGPGSTRSPHPALSALRTYQNAVPHASHRCSDLMIQA